MWCLFHILSAVRTSVLYVLGTQRSLKALAARACLTQFFSCLSSLPVLCVLCALPSLHHRHSPTHRSLKALAARACVWDGAYQRLFGTPPPSEYSVTTVKRLCRRSELKASR